MKIGTYNLKFLFDEGIHLHSGKEHFYSKEYTDLRVAYFAKEFVRLDADVLFLQELGSESVLERILDVMGGAYRYVIATPDKNHVGNAVIYRTNETTCRSVPTNTSFPVFIEGDQDVIGSRMQSRRDYVEVTLPHRGRTLSMLGLHIQSSWHIPLRSADSLPQPMDTQLRSADGLIRTEVFRLTQARKAREMVDSYFNSDPDSFVAVMGDFNTKPSEKVLDVIQGPLTSDRDHLVSALDRLPDEHRFSINSSWSGKSLIDHVLVSRTLHAAILSAHIYNEELFNHHTDPRHPYIVESDHAAILIEI